MTKGRIIFHTSSEVWNKGFEWAKEQALAYSHEGDLVGDWYEAALPSRQAFCIRDVAHHARGAEALGLRTHTKNMLLRFVQSIAESRKFCAFWEIDKDYRPCPVDYSSDADFWYNLPANFDLLDVCWRMYQMTGDRDYLFQSDFVRFYNVTIEDYVNFWDIDQDGLLERKYPASRLGIPSYCEDNQFDNALALIDMLAIEIRGYQSAAEIFGCRGEGEKQRRCLESAKKLEDMLRNRWWDEERQKFYHVKDEHGCLRHSDEIGHALSLCYYDVIKDRTLKERQLDLLHEEMLENQGNVESLSHYPVLFYRGGRPRQAAYWLTKVIDPQLSRREYPEVSYGAVEAFVYEMAGISPDAPSASMRITPQLPDDMDWFRLENLPFLDGELDIAFEQGVLHITNRTSGEVIVNQTAIGSGSSALLNDIK